MLVGQSAPVCAHPTHVHLVCSTKVEVLQLVASGTHHIDVVARLPWALDEHWHHNKLTLHA